MKESHEDHEEISISHVSTLGLDLELSFGLWINARDIP